MASMDQILQMSSNLISDAGLPFRTKEELAPFEEHFSLNKQILVIVGNTVVFYYNINYVDAPQEEISFTSERRFSWSRPQSVFQLPSDKPLSEDILIQVINNPFCGGFPVGIVTDNPQKIEELLKLGAVSADQYSTVVSLKTGEKVHIYPTSNRPIVYSSMFSSRDLSQIQFDHQFYVDCVRKNHRGYSNGEYLPDVLAGQQVSLFYLNKFAQEKKIDQKSYFSLVVLDVLYNSYIEGMPVELNQNPFLREGELSERIRKLNDFFPKEDVEPRTLENAADI
ncbi:MAG: hypothetical protein NDI94_05925, partial [Candidatus Woesearchaeota archaeon]|nr:hypothetical protein [Candidatus Woesearchaeota archaeon]